MKKHIGFSFNLIALLLFFPGVFLPIFSLDMELKADVGVTSIVSPIIDKELSILTTVQELWVNDKFLVAILIFLFSVCIPLIKTGLMSWVYFVKNHPYEQKIMGFVSAIGKWSMADVFTVAIFLAILSTNHSDTATSKQLSMFGLNLDLVISSASLSSAGIGFYFFTAYCLLSLLGTQISLSGRNGLVKG